MLIIACNEEQWLEEVPLSFYSPENSYVEPEHFNSAVVRLYSRYRDDNWNNTGERQIGNMGDNMYAIGTRVSLHHNEMVPETGFTLTMWQNAYARIFDANTILGRIDNAEFGDETERNVRKAEASFFRANAYKELLIIYGGVPLVLEEIQSPRRDFVRATRDEVLDQVVEDLEFAVANLPHVSEITEDGRLTTAAASHELTVVYIMQERWDDAVNEASKVINDPSYALMTERFGTRSNEPGDVFWDLFRRGNQNRNGTGGPNTEAIFVAQYEHNVEGSPSNPNAWWIVPRMFGPGYYNLNGKADGVPLFRGHSSQNGGRTNYFSGATDYVSYDIWEEDWDDMRNSEYNIWRDMVADNPNSMYYGQKIIESGAIDINDHRDAPGAVGNWRRWWYPFWMKYVPVNNYPEEVIDNSLFPGATTTQARGSYMDVYAMRLSETYLLRAEAYIGKGDLQSAADDINVVRSRANATPVTPDRVNIGYLLDERARELHLEEFRTWTLMRMGLLVERVQKYHPHYNGHFETNTLNPRISLFPIPHSEIERNTEAVLEQNPGYH